MLVNLENQALRTSGGVRVTIELRCGSSNVVFQHDGAPFSSDELAGLLSGGWCKASESDVTSGRFGKAFLVTYGLAHRNRVKGLLEVPTGYE